MRVWDEELKGADALAVARVLAALVEPEAPDLGLCGVQSSDAVSSATGIALAGYLDAPDVAVVTGSSWTVQTRGSVASSRADWSSGCGSGSQRC